MTLTVGSLFSGIGGFEFAFDRAGMSTIWQSEIDRQCLEVLTHHWPEAEQLGDVRNVGKGTRAVDLICGGFPCQDLSVAGKRKGLAGSKSGLWFEFHRVLAELKPRWVVVENVTGLLSSGERRDFAIILQGLADLGYLSAWRVFDAQYAGVAQRRRRVFIVGHLGDGRAAEVLFESTGRAWDPPPSRETGPGTSGAIGIQPANTGATGRGWQREVTHTFSGSQLAVAFSRQDDGRDATVDLAPTMRVGTTPGPRAATAGNLAVAGVPAIAPTLTQTIADGNRKGWAPVNEADALIVWDNGQGDPNAEKSDISYSLNPQMNQGVAGALSAHHGRNCGDDTFVATGLSENLRGELRLTDYACSLSSGGGKPGQGYPAALTRLGVRRLTPTECERLQGFPDGHTAVNGMSDSPRYRMLGNAIAVPVAEWIGRRITAAEGVL